MIAEVENAIMSDSCGSGVGVGVGFGVGVAVGFGVGVDESGVSEAETSSVGSTPSEASGVLSGPSDSMGVSDAFTSGVCAPISSVATASGASVAIATGGWVASGRPEILGVTPQPHSNSDIEIIMQTKALNFELIRILTILNEFFWGGVEPKNHAAVTLRRRIKRRRSKLLIYKHLLFDVESNTQYQQGVGLVYSAIAVVICKLGVESCIVDYAESVP